MSGTLVTSPYVVYLLVAYGVTTLVIVGNIVAVRGRLRRVKRRMQQQLQRRSTISQKTVTEKL
ncbi:MAG: heme exporter protein CcmD [Gammaproteobacteria bacterium]